MAPEKNKSQTTNQDEGASHRNEPRGFGIHTRGLSGEYAHEQGWGLDVEERTRISKSPQNTEGGDDYDYGARDFGDEATRPGIEQKSTPNIRKSPKASRQTASS